MPCTLGLDVRLDTHSTTTSMVHARRLPSWPMWTSPSGPTATRQATTCTPTQAQSSRMSRWTAPTSRSWSASWQRTAARWGRQTRCAVHVHAVQARLARSADKQEKNILGSSTLAPLARPPLHMWGGCSVGSFKTQRRLGCRNRNRSFSGLSRHWLKHCCSSLDVWPGGLPRLKATHAGCACMRARMRHCQVS